MPKTLSSKEIAEIKKRHEELVGQINKVLPSDKQIKADKYLDEKLSDPNLVNTYRIAQELKAKREAQERINRRLNGDPTVAGIHKPFPFPSKFITDNTREGNKYNQDLYHEFISNPDKVYYQNFKKLFATSARELNACGNNPQKLAEFYRDHFEEVEAADHFMETLKDIRNVSPDLQKQLPSMQKLVSLVAYPKKITMQHESVDLLACPDLNLEQANIVKANGIDFLEQTSPDVVKHINEDSKEVREDSPQEFFDKFSDRSNPPHEANAFITKYSAFKMENNEKVYVPLEQKLTDDKVKMVYANKSRATFRIELPTLKAQKEYLKQWQKTFNEKRHFRGNFDIAQIEDSLKGGFFERKVFGSTSRQYKEMLQAFKDFNDPNSNKYLDYKHLRDKTEGYLDHKQAQGYGTRKELKGTSLARSNFARAILDTIDDHDKIFKATDAELSKGVEVPSLNNRHPMPLTEEELFDLHPHNNENVMENQIEVNNNLEVNDSNEIDNQPELGEID